jgi:hypothetical protein
VRSGFIGHFTSPVFPGSLAFLSCPARKNVALKLLLPYYCIKPGLSMDGRDDFYRRDGISRFIAHFMQSALLKTLSPISFYSLSLLRSIVERVRNFSQIQGELEKQEAGWFPNIKGHVRLTLKIGAILILDVLIITIIILAFAYLIRLLEYLELGDNPFLNNLLTYSENAALIFYIAFAIISITGVLIEEGQIKLTNMRLTDRNGLKKNE